MVLTLDSRTIIVAFAAATLGAAGGCGSSDAGSGTGGATGVAPGSGGSMGTNTGGAGWGSSTGGSGTGGSSGPSVVEACPSYGNILASSASNFSFWSEVTFPNVTKVAPKTELSFDWSAVTTDFLTKPFNPASDVVLVTLALWEITPEEFAAGIDDDTLGSPAVAAFLQTQGQVTQTGLFSLTPPAGAIPQDQMLSFFDIDIYPPGSNFYTLMVGSDLTPGVGTRMIGAFELSADTANTAVTLSNESMALDYEVDFSASQPTLVPAGNASITVDWSGMETLSTTETDPTKLNAAGRPFLKRSIKQVKVASYSKTEAEIKQKETLLMLDELADATYLGDVTSGSTFNLSELKDASGNPFVGIDGSHTWLLALINTDSRNPAPWYLTFLKECR